MPKLLLFVPCLKAISGNDGLLTIVSLLEFVAIGIPENAILEPMAATQLQWQLVSAWHKEPEDEGKQFQIKVDIVLPNKTIVALYENDLQLIGRTTKAVIDGGMIFPIGLQGEHLLRLKLREIGGRSWKIVGEYPVNVNHQGTPTP